MYDAVIVGARCAGAPLAMLLARQGHSVAMVDRARFPSDTMSTHFVQSPGMARLARWGLLDELMATNCPPLHSARFDVTGEEPLDFEIPAAPGIPGLTAPRRYILDKILIDAAVAAGAELVEGVSIDSLIRDDTGRVAGVEGHAAGGPFEARGRFVIGADGRHSLVAREAQAEKLHDTAPLTSGYYTYFSGIEGGLVETFFHEERFCVTFPTHDGLQLVAVGWPHDHFKQLKSDVEGNFMRALDGFGTLGERARAGKREERFVGTADVPNFIRKSFGPGWALVGDAGYHKDPVPADGISDAFRAADYLADTLHDIFSGESDEAGALARYEERHNEVAVPLLDAAVRSADFGLTPAARRDAFFEIRFHDATEAVEVLSATNGAPVGA